MKDDPYWTLGRDMGIECTLSVWRHTSITSSAWRHTPTHTLFSLVYNLRNFLYIEIWLHWKEHLKLPNKLFCKTLVNFDKKYNYCTVLHCTVLYCTPLYCTVLYCTVLYCTVLYCTVLYCTVKVSKSNIILIQKAIQLAKGSCCVPAIIMFTF